MPGPVDRAHLIRRIYTAATASSDEGGFTVMLDGRAAKTPAGARLTVPTHALAERLAGEWAAQGAQVDFSTMPGTRLAFTTLDRTAKVRPAVAAEVAKLGAADLLCYFAEGPASLVARQDAQWAPWLAWAARDLGVALIRATGVTHQDQPAEALAAIEALATAEDDFGLSGLAFAGGLYGSAVLAFAVRQGALSGEAAFDLSRLDEAFQEERWGVDHDAAVRTEALRQDARMIGDWFRALDDQAP